MLGQTGLCTIATVTPSGQPYANTAFIAFTDTLIGYFLSDPASIHAGNICLNAEIAVTIFDSGQNWGDDLVGAQLFGRCEILARGADSEALASYENRYPAYREYVASLSPSERETSTYRFFRFTVERIKLLDEEIFGEETFVVAKVPRGPIAD